MVRPYQYMQYMQGSSVLIGDCLRTFHHRVTIMLRCFAAGVTKDAFFEIWKEEAEVALNLRNKGKLDLFKVVGQRDVGQLFLYLEFSCFAHVN